jgi:hypothetical protein
VRLLRSLRLGPDGGRSVRNFLSLALTLLCGSALASSVGYDGSAILRGPLASVAGPMVPSVGFDRQHTPKSFEACGSVQNHTRSTPEADATYCDPEILAWRNPD